MAAAVAAPANGPPLAAAPAAPKDDALADLLPSEEDLLYEEELLRNPYSLRMWLRYLDARKSASPRKRYLLYERALNALPGSYKVRPAGRGSALPRQHGAEAGLPDQPAAAAAAAAAQRALRPEVCPAKGAARNSELPGAAELAGMHPTRHCSQARLLLPRPAPPACSCGTPTCRSG